MFSYVLLAQVFLLFFLCKNYTSLGFLEYFLRITIIILSYSLVFLMTTHVTRWQSTTLAILEWHKYCICKNRANYFVLLLFSCTTFVLLLFYSNIWTEQKWYKSGTKDMGGPLEDRDNYCNTLRTTSEAIWTSRIR